MTSGNGLTGGADRLVTAPYISKDSGNGKSNHSAD